jgi:hypothetical protein
MALKQSSKPGFERIDKDRAVFTRGDRVYRLSNLSNNRLVGKFIVMIKAFTLTNDELGYVDRVNIFHQRSRNTFAKFASQRWGISATVAKRDMTELLQQLLVRGYVTEPTKPAREFGKPWSSSTTNRQADRLKRHPVVTQ